MRYVYRRELANYLKTPVGYLFLGMFTLVAGVMFAFVNLDRYQTASVYTLFSGLQLPFLVIAPLLTMRLLAEEKRTRTDQLLLTSPLSLTAIVAGKLLSAVTMLLAALALALLFPLLICGNATLYPSVILSVYLGFFLMNCCVLAIGLLMSALCESQVSAGILTLGVNLLLYLGEMYALPQLNTAALRPLYKALSFLALGARFDSFSSGVIALKQVVFFLSTTLLMAYLTVRVLARRQKVKG